VVDVINGATNVRASCAFNDAVLDGETDKWWPCFRDRATQDEHLPLLQRNIETWVQFSSKTGQLRVNQTWYCNSENGLTPYKITATARAPMYRGNSREGLMCGEGNNTFYNVSCPQSPLSFVYGDSCDFTYHAKWCTLGDRDGYFSWNAPEPLVMPTDTLDVVRLSAGGLAEPEPSPDIWSCTVASLGRGPIKWTLQQSHWFDPGFFTQTDWFGVFSDLPEVPSTWFLFNLNSSVFAGFPPTVLSKDGVVRDLGIRQEYNGWTMTPWTRTFNPSRTISDMTESDGYTTNYGWKFYNALDWQFRFDISTGYMELNHSWYCDDKNLDTPIIFNGTWNGYIPLSCEWRFPGPRTGDVTRQGVTCDFADGKKEIVVTPVVTSRVSQNKLPYRVPSPWSSG
jgi:hypothetical protein